MKKKLLFVFIVAMCGITYSCIIDHWYADYCYVINHSEGEVTILTDTSQWVIPSGDTCFIGQNICADAPISFYLQDIMGDSITFMFADSSSVTYYYQNDECSDNNIYCQLNWSFFARKDNEWIKDAYYIIQ